MICQLQISLGINHGPVIAGVIGARKPQYDIWGNTVNVASRMESTGELGKIQVKAHLRPVEGRESGLSVCQGILATKFWREPRPRRPISLCPSHSRSSSSEDLGFFPFRLLKRHVPSSRD